MSQSVSRNDGMHLLKEIIKDTSRDVGTQTLHAESSKNKTPSGKGAVDDKTASRLDTSRRTVLNSCPTTDKKSSNPNYKSSFRLFIVPDADGEEQWPGLRLSLQDLQSKSLHLSVTSPSAESPNALNSKRPKRSGEIGETKTETSVDSLEKRKGRNLKSATATAERSDRFVEEHQLIRSLNPSVIAWLKLKNFEERQKRKAKKREKRELKRVEREEEERRKGREVESEKKFTQWLGTKKEEAKRVYRGREYRASTKVSPGEAKREFPNDDDPSPTDYTVVASFNGAQAVDEGLHSARVDETTVKAGNLTSRQETSLKRQKKIKRPRSTTAVRDRDNTTREHLGKRPNTANARMIVDSGIEQNVVIEGSKGITYVAWMERKRGEDKEKAKQIKREVVDDALTEGILKLARRRAENIRQGKKEVDTGVPKWRAKNRVMNSASEGTPPSTDTSSTVRSQYVFRTDLEKQTSTDNPKRNSSLDSQDRTKARGKNTTMNGWREIEMIRQFCENVKLDTSEDGVLAAGEPHGLEYAVVEETNAT